MIARRWHHHEDVGGLYAEALTTEPESMVLKKWLRALCAPVMSLLCSVEPSTWSRPLSEPSSDELLEIVES